MLRGDGGVIQKKFGLHLIYLPSLKFGLSIKSPVPLLLLSSFQKSFWCGGQLLGFTEKGTSSHIDW